MSIPTPRASNCTRKKTPVICPLTPAGACSGYDYPCEAPMASTDRFCPIKFVPFRGVNCSDAAGHEIEYHLIQDTIDNNQSLTGRMWDESVQSPWYNYKATDGTTHQRWFDDPQSLSLKYAEAKKMGLRGVGPFCYSDIVYDTDVHKAHAEAMWKAVHAFTQ